MHADQGKKPYMQPDYIHEMVTGTGEHGAFRAGELPMSRILVSGCGGPAGHAVRELLLQRGHSVKAVDMKKSDSIRIIQVPQVNDPNFV